MKQPQLFNTAPMASTQAIQALRRARGVRALESFLKGSTTITADNSSAKPATEPGALLKPYGGRSPESVMEFNLPDEDRVLCEVLTINRCCECGVLPRLRYSVQHTNPFMKGFYKVECRACGNSTPWLKSSAEAIQHWRVVAILSKP